MAGAKDTIDVETRLRIAANLRLLRHERRYKSVAAMAKGIGMSRSALGRYLSGERTVGLDVLLLIRRKLNISIDWIVDRPPDDKRWFDPDYWPKDEKK